MANQHSETNDSKSLCILVADDLEVNRKIAQFILQKAGHRVDLAENGQQAVAACKRHRYDLIFMDIQMPVMDGYEATRQIRELQLIAHSSKLKAMEEDPSSPEGFAAASRGQREEVEKPREMIGMTGRFYGPNGRPLGRWEGEKEESEVGMRKSEKGQDSALKSKIRNPKSKIDFVPIIAMTGNACEGGFNESRYPGMDDSIDKPIQRDRLLEMVLKWTRPANDMPASDRPIAVSLPVSKKSGNGQLPFDFDRAVQEFMGQKKRLFSVLKGFIENAGIRVDVIRRAVKSNDHDLIALEAHAVKGGAANLTADVLAATAAALEQAAVKRRTELIRQLAAELELELHDLQTFIHGKIIGRD